jgi:hypothetical protein
VRDSRCFAATTRNGRRHTSARAAHAAKLDALAADAKLRAAERLYNVAAARLARKVSGRTTTRRIVRSLSLSRPNDERM